MPLHHHTTGPTTAPPLLLGPSLGTPLSVWDPQIPALSAHFNVTRWDLPGHGASPAALLKPGATVADLAHLVLDLADSLGITRFAYAGISLGGAVGSWLAVHHPDRIASLALVCTSARFGTPDMWADRAALVRRQGTAPLAESAPSRWFTTRFDGPAVERLRAGQRAADPDAYAACCDALAAFDLRGDLGRITAPTLVVAGREDRATPPADARLLADGIPDAALTEIPRAAHLANVERPEPVLAALLGHFTATGAPDQAAPDQAAPDRVGPDQAAPDRVGPDQAAPRPTKHATGTSVRRQVLGDAHVDRAVARTTPFTARFQDFITRYAWGEIWNGDILDRRTRSCITLTALVAGGHRDELALHVRAAVRNGLSPDEIGEVLLQSAVYCGVPAANAAFAVADAVLREIAAEETDRSRPDHTETDN
ncbi:3-oxoadipate enol-lactonase [Streptomyces sp. NPDC004111]|uniref:bifunctional 3-oxoadipate enol-lactonase/4-carboxymuconolactone decarboxylase PcaDC n=1 Tax=Streptomyces sp. NPDC004111 TaxID=3364690 RepID=UPI0036B533EF